MHLFTWGVEDILPGNNLSHGGKCENMRTKITAYLNPTIVLLGTETAAALALLSLNISPQPYLSIVRAVRCSILALVSKAVHVALPEGKSHTGKNPAALRKMCCLSLQLRKNLG